MIRSKKAQIEKIGYDHIFQGALALVVVIILFTFFMNISSDEDFKKKVLATNNAFLLDILIPSNGNTYIEKTWDSLNYKYEFSETEIKVSSEDDIIKSPMFLLQSKNIKIIPTQIKPKKQITFLKTGNKIQIGENLQPDYDKLICPFIPIKLPDNILLMPLSIEEEQYSLTQDLKTDLADTFKQIQIQNTFQQNPGIILQIKRTTEKNILKAEISLNSQESRRIACLILNKALLSNPELEASITPSDIFSENQIAITLILNPELEIRIIRSIINTFNELK